MKGKLMPKWLDKLDKKLSFVLMIGKSMKPSMGIIDLVWTEPPDCVAVGDVVGFKRNRFAKLIHRVIDIDEEKQLYYIKGDNAPEIDCVPFSSVLFKVQKFKKIL